MTEKQYTFEWTDDHARLIAHSLKRQNMHGTADDIYQQIPPSTPKWKVGDWFYLKDIGYRCRIVDINLNRVTYHWRHKDGTPDVAWDWVEMLDDAEHREPPLSWEGDR